MKFAAILGVKDEIELLPLVIEHLFAIGVDLIIVRDNASSDGSREYVQSRQSPRLRFEPLSREEESNDSLWAQREGEIARSCDADWVMFLDADEFWLPASGQLARCPEFHDPAIDVLSVRRFNAIVSRDAEVVPRGFGVEQYPSIDLVVAAPARDFRLHLEQNASAAWITGVPRPKVTVRRSRAGAVHLGHHDIHSVDGTPMRTATPGSLVIAHYPFTSYPRFQRKVANIQQLLQAHAGILPGNAAWHWKRWVRIAAQPGGLEAEYERQRFDAQELQAMRDKGVISDAATLLAPAAPAGAQ
jgi:hypothetical protein